MSKILKRDVDAAHDRYATEACKWGDDNLATVRAMARYWDLRTAWETQTGRTYSRGRSKS